MFRSDCLFYICKLIINMLNTTDGVEVHLDITKVYRLSLGVRRIAQIFLKPIVEKLVVFRAKMWAQMGKRVVSWETRSYFFFWYGIQWNSADQNGGIHVLFGYKSLKHRGGIHWNQGILAKLEAFGLQLRQNPWFQWNHHGFQAFNPKTRETAILIGRVSLKPYQKKKRAVSLLKPSKVS